MSKSTTNLKDRYINEIRAKLKEEFYNNLNLLLPNDTTNKNIIFESSNPSILSIDKHAVMHGHKEGIVTVTYTVLANPDLSGSFEVAVYVDAYIDAKYETTSVVTVGESIKINAEVKSASGKVVWDSSDKNVATVDKNGIVTASAITFFNDVKSISYLITVLGIFDNSSIKRLILVLITGSSLPVNK